MRHYAIDDSQWELAVEKWAQDVTLDIAEVFSATAWDLL